MPIDKMRRETLVEQGLSVTGGVCPEGYEFIGWICPNDPSYRCIGCDVDDDMLPTNCGKGIRHYRHYRSRGLNKQ